MSVLVIMEQRAGGWTRMSFETLAAGQQLAAALGETVSAVLPGRAVAALAEELMQLRLDCIYAVEHDLLEPYTADGFTLALEQLIRQLQPSLVLFPHTYQVRDFAPKLATRFHQALIGDVVAVRQDGCPVFVRQLFQGKLQADIRPAGPPPYFVSIQAGAFNAEAIESGEAPLETFTPTLSAADIRQRPSAPFREAAGAVDLSAADIIVGVGRGIKEKDNIPMVEQLAQALGGELAATRPVCDNGWLPSVRQVGSSGQTVSPKVYIAVGISGAIQHLVGMKGAKSVVAINKDADAPIFEIADYGIVGDLFEVVPALVEGVRKVKG
jgi:electron transfer flavoprotein alpha subunit